MPSPKIERSDAELAQVTVGERVPHNSTIFLQEYDPQWPRLYAAERQRIQAALGAGARQIEHVGSTSVPGLCAKPIIDMLLLVADSADESAYLPAMQKAGYTLRIREPDWHQHRMFKGPGTDCNIHVFTVGSEEAQRMLLFRDWLRAHPEDRDLYAAAKRRLAARVWRHVQHYADAKTAVVQQIMQRALASAGSDR